MRCKLNIFDVDDVIRDFKEKTGLSVISNIALFELAGKILRKISDESIRSVTKEEYEALMLIAELDVISAVNQGYPKHFAEAFEERVDMCYSTMTYIYPESCEASH